MATTIQVNEDTRDMLNEWKSSTNKTYNDVIKYLMNIQKPKSFYGILKSGPDWNKETDRMSSRYED